MIEKTAMMKILDTIHEFISNIEYAMKNSFTVFILVWTILLCISILSIIFVYVNPSSTFWYMVAVVIVSRILYAGIKGE